ncbi:MAG: Rho termination factor N-terminal domain-containing protein, partial [Bdellovibrionales bacterium]|nr:Rho termination factor N-terminal domain-containing protein [Bdellovibrionales bacterium]
GHPEDTLRTRSPLIDRSMESAYYGPDSHSSFESLKETAVEQLQAAAEAVKSRPAVALGIAGAAGFLIAGGILGARRRQASESKPSELYSRSTESLSQNLAQISGAIRAMLEKAEQPTSDAIEGTKDAAHAARLELEEFADSVQHSIGRASEDIKRYAEEGVRAARDSASRHPIATGCALAGLALAVGAMTTRESSGSNGRSGATRRNGRVRPYEERTRDELYERARELNIEGRSQMSKEELIEALRNA